MEPLTAIFLCGAAFIAGFIDSIAGGGGLITTPALLISGLPAHMVLGTNKFLASFGTTFAVINFHRKAKIIWNAALVGIPAALVGALIGAKAALFIPEGVLAKAIIILLPPAAGLLFFSKSLLKKTKKEAMKGKKFWFATAAASFAIGFYDGIFGPAAGTFYIVALALVSKMPLVNASATAKTLNFASNIGGLFTFIYFGQVYYPYAIVMAVANIVGNWIGSHAAMKRGDEFVNKLLFVVMALLFGYLVWKYY